ncbi:MAG: hypothetical protein H6619_05160 [Deltaproteobacteria bacterium]|nr:hypothetical protein [Deltaproteobacteria bacterium]
MFKVLFRSFLFLISVTSLFSSSAFAQHPSDACAAKEVTSTVPGFGFAAETSSQLAQHMAEGFARRNACELAQAVVLIQSECPPGCVLAEPTTFISDPDINDCSKLARDPNSGITNHGTAVYGGSGFLGRIAFISICQAFSDPNNDCESLYDDFGIQFAGYSYAEFKVTASVKCEPEEKRH